MAYDTPENVVPTSKAITRARVLPPVSDEEISLATELQIDDSYRMVCGCQKVASC
jgi:hypothetical protein